jgi:hypothetical protein
MGEMRFLDGSGDQKMIWNPDNHDEVMATKDVFEKLIDKGYKAFKVDKNGRKSGSGITSFDKNLGKIIMVPEIAGG